MNIKKELKKKNVGITKFNPDIITIIENMDYKQRKGLCNRLIKSTHEVEIPVMEEAYKEGILTKKEYEKEYRHKLVDPTSGADSFPELMQAVMFNKRNPDSDKIIFVSTNSMILKNRKKLSKRFNIEIKDPKEALEMIIEGKEELPDAM